MRNADQTQKKQTKEVATNDESDAAAAISELDDMPTNTKMPPGLYNRRTVLIFRNRRRWRTIQAVGHQTKTLVMLLKMATIRYIKERTRHHTVY